MRLNALARQIRILSEAFKALPAGSANPPDLIPVQNPHSCPETNRATAEEYLSIPGGETGEPMHDRFQDGNRPTRERRVFKPPAWLSTSELEDELMGAIQASGGEEIFALAIIDEYFSGDDEFEEEAEHRQVLLWLLSLLRPRLANLLGGPPAN